MKLSSGFRVLLTTLILLCGISGSIAAPGDREYQIKIAFLTNFISYTQWPDITRKTESSEFVFCSSSERFVEIARPALKGKQVENKPIRLTAVDPGEEWQCDLLFILVEEADLWVKYLSEVDAEGILIVGERRGFAHEVGNINFFLAGNKLRFEINLDSLENSGLKISSRLLRLAKLIRNEETSND
ncbi:YfiR family protein [Amphritea sp. HPY]|uniref:YfiR family protein n=1 Tax=Amphritea sp. HPY TaxID=3421652 RepID=UPI003D7F101D